MASVNIGAMTDEAKAAAAAAAKAANAKNGVAEKPSGSNGQLNADFNFFLKMLTTQLQHQDPSQPMDTSQMTQQIATFSGVEQQVQTNSKLDQLLSSNSTVTHQSQLASAANLIGREIETQGRTGQVLGGQGAFSYILPEKAQSVEIVIKNAEGTTVFSGAGTANKGRNVLLWDGINSSTENQEPDGMYTITVSAKNSEGKAMTAETRSVGIVGGFETDKDGNIVLNVGDAVVKYDDVLTVRPATRAVFTDPDSGDDSGDGGEADAA